MLLQKTHENDRLKEEVEDERARRTQVEGVLQLCYTT